MIVAKNVLDLIGNTPIVNLAKISPNIFGKCEFANPTSSVKDRPALNLIKSAIESGKVDEDTTLIEPTSGNTGIALASICASMNLKLILTMPESMSIERRKLLKFLGAEIVLTPKELGMGGAVKKAEELKSETQNSIIVGQFDNEANPAMHRVTTAKEIIEQMSGDIDIFVAGVGTGGTITGVGEVLKQKIPNIKVVAVEPSASAILSGNPPAPHKIQGIGAGFVPKVLNTHIFDEIVQVDNESAFEMSREIAQKEGILVGISSGANVYASLILAKKYPDKKIVTILCDTAERYLSTELFDKI